MATITLEFTKKGLKGGRSVTIRVTSNREHKRIPTGIRLEANEYREYMDGRIKITNNEKYYRVMDLISDLQKKIREVEERNPLIRLGAKELCDLALKRNSVNPGMCNFFEYTEKWLEKEKLKGEHNYRSMLNNLERFHGSRYLPFHMISVTFLNGFEAFLAGKPSAQAHCMASIRRVYNQAALEFNTDTEFFLSPTLFRRYKVPQLSSRGQRALSVDEVMRFVAYTPQGRMEEMCKDCCILSLCMMGTNSVDLYNMEVYDGEKVCYERTKTKDRREDRAYIEIKIDPLIRPLMEKYKGERTVFRFSELYSSYATFNHSINKTLKTIGRNIGVDKLQFYRFRHTWATIARNECGIDRGTVDEALNHLSSNDLLDIYVKKDFRIINEANKKVIDFVFRRNVQNFK